VLIAISKLQLELSMVKVATPRRLYNLILLPLAVAATLGVRLNPTYYGVSQIGELSAKRSSHVPGETECFLWSNLGCVCKGSCTGSRTSERALAISGSRLESVKFELGESVQDPRPSSYSADYSQRHCQP
jgi:hypothetical protein